MKIMEKFAKKSANLNDEPPVTIAFFGDSVTQGCFELYRDGEQAIATVFDKNNTYHSHLAKILNVLYPSVPVNMINAGISGDSAARALERIDRDVLRCSPDLVVVCFGLNDCGQGEQGIDSYAEALSGIFTRLKEAGTEIIFMTPNMMNTAVSPHLREETLRETARLTMERQNSGLFDMYMQRAGEVCREHGITVCDCYKKWKLLADNGVAVTELLANKINHPTREMNWLFAISLFETMLSHCRLELRTP